MAKKKKNTAAMRRQAELEKRQQFGKNAAKKNREKQLQNQPQKQAVIQQPAQASAKKATGTPAKVAPVWKREDNIAPLSLIYKASIKTRNIDFTAPITIRVQSLSPMHLGSGQANVNVDAEVIHDDTGLPYFPAKRFKGLLYESALEVAEISELAGLDLLDKKEIDTLFQHGCVGEKQLIVSNLYLEDYEQMHEAWQYLQGEFPALFQATDVLEQYTSLRYQTKIDRETGTAADTSLHNMRVVDEGLSFEGQCCVKNGNRRTLEILALALRNLSQSGLKRTRGFGRIACTMEQDGKDLLRPILREILTAAERSL